MDKLKKYHAYLVMFFVFLITCFVTGDFIFFPFACIFLCLFTVGYLKDTGRLALPEDSRRKVQASEEKNSSETVQSGQAASENAGKQETEFPE